MTLVILVLDIIRTNVTLLELVGLEGFRAMTLVLIMPNPLIFGRTSVTSSGLVELVTLQ